MKRIILIIGLLLMVSNVNANIGYNELNLLDHKINNFIHVNSDIPLTNYTFELKTGINWVGIPFNTSIIDADTMLTSIPGTTFITGDNIQWWNFTSQRLETYSERPPFGHTGTNFLVKANRGYTISLGRDTNWTITCLQPTNPTLQYQIFDLNKYYGTNIIRPRWSPQHD